MTNPTEHHEDAADQDAVADVAEASDGSDGHGDPEELANPDEEAVRRLKAGPTSPEGKVEVAAAGIDTPH